MKAQRRHELKENVLAHELVQVKEFFGRYGTWILIAVAAAAVVYLGYGRLKTSRQAEYANEKTRYTELVVTREMKPQERAEGLANLFETARNPVIAAAAGLEAGQTWARMHMDALVRSDVVPTEQADTYRRKAQEMFEKVLAAQPEKLWTQAGAHEGLALVAENMALAAVTAGDETATKQYVAQAQEQYQEVARLLGPSDPATRNARERIEALNHIGPIRFATTLPAPETQPAPATAPATAPGTAPATAPSPG